MLGRMRPVRLSLPAFAARTAVVHTITYMFMGVLAASLLDYEAAFRRPYMACWMRPVSDPVVMAGPLLQPLRGVVFALALFPRREAIFGRRLGWLVLWGLLTGLGIVNTFGPAPGSLEAMLYTVVPVPDQFKGYLEVVPQSALLAFLLVHWVEHPEKRWLTRLLVALFAIAIALPLLGLLARGHGA
jgi:hypothetical protein